MGFWQKIFSGGSILERAEKAFARGDWGEAFSYAAECSDAGLAESDRTRLTEIVATAGRRLAELNLEQAEACLRAQDLPRAVEHVRLILEQTDDAELLQRARSLVEGTPAVVQQAPQESAGCASCSTNSGHAGHGVTAAAAAEGLADLDSEQSWELFLLGLPDQWAERYCQHGPEFVAAVAAAHSSEWDAAAELFAKVPEAERDHLYHYELACLKLHSGQNEAGMALLLEVLAACPGHELAMHVALDLARLGRCSTKEWRHLFLTSIEQRQHVGLSHAALAFLALADGDQDAFEVHAEQAIGAGFRDQELVVRLARLFEDQGRIDQAEGLLQGLGAAGCGGGIHPLLAEFWLRHGKNLDQALESFKAAARSEREEPRWQLRIAQTYQAKGWLKEGAGLLRALLEKDALPDGMRQEAMAALDRRSP